MTLAIATIILFIVCLITYFRLVSLEKRSNEQMSMIESLKSGNIEKDIAINNLARLVCAKQDKRVKKL